MLASTYCIENKNYFTYSHSNVYKTCSIDLLYIYTHMEMKKKWYSRTS